MGLAIGDPPNGSTPVQPVSAVWPSGVEDARESVAATAVHVGHPVDGAQEALDVVVSPESGERLL